MKTGIYINGRKVVDGQSFSDVLIRHGSTPVVNGHVSGTITGHLIVDGQKIELDMQSPALHIEVIGNVSNLSSDSASIAVTGNTEHVETNSGDIYIDGNVHRNIKTMSGDVRCNKVQGSIRTFSGHIYC